MWQETWGSSRAATGTSGTHSETQVSLQVARGLSGILFSWCRGIGPHLQLRPEPQFPSPVLTWISGILWMFNRGVRPRFVWRNGTPLSSSGVKGLSGFLSSWPWDPGFFYRCSGAVTRPFVFSADTHDSSQGSAGESGLSGVDGEFGIFSNRGMTPGDVITFQGETGLLLRGHSNFGIPFPTKQRNRHSCRVEEDKNRALLELWRETQCSSHVRTGISGTFLSCMKGVKYPFSFQQTGTWDFSGDTALEKGLILH